MRSNPLKIWKLFAGVGASIKAGVEDGLKALVHPCAADDPIEEQRHIVFMAGCFAAGGIACVVLPLALALLGEMSLDVAIVLGWMMAQLPLALFLSQTGKLEQAYIASTGLFALFLTAMCGVSGGVASFALIWFAVLPIEAAFAGSQRLIMGVFALCAVLIGALAFVPMPEIASAGSTTVIASAAGALAYVTGLSLRFVHDLGCLKSAVSQAEKRFAILDEAAGDVILQLHADGSAMPLGGPLEKILDMSRRQAHGDWLFQRLHVSDRPAYMSALSDARAAAAGEAAVDLPALQVRLRKGASVPGQAGKAEYIWVCLEFTASQGANTGLRLMLRDVTDERAQSDEIERARQEAEDASITKTRFIASASHELRTPLNAIIGYADLLRGVTGHVAPAQAREYAGLIHQSGHHLLQLVEDILDASRIETGHMELSIAPVDMADCIANCRAMMVPLADNAGVTLSCAPMSDLPLVPADSRAVKQILLNLISNAVKYAGRGANIDLNASVCGNLVKIEVRDNGIGIPVTQLARLGQPFVRIEGPQSAAKGSGLGLSIVKGLAELHGGHFELESVEGRGVTATVSFPLGRTLRKAPAGAQGETIAAAAKPQTNIDPAGIDLAQSA
ncbi:MAG: HAMP domain-containing histidine kinase [Rhodobacteraceae bacterium]|nr:HAMP domain-containing histidine kinase [Paracoccaceae bacterium]